jgi:hypothetical protein
MPKGVYPRPRAIERFDQRWVPEPTTGCHLWIGPVDKDGYGKFNENRRAVRAHRFAYEQRRGPIPPGLVLDHVVCDTPSCCNEWHVEPRTVKENTLRGRAPSAKNAAKTHCKHGHVFDAANTYWSPNRERACRTCFRLRARRTRAEIKAKAGPVLCRTGGTSRFLGVCWHKARKRWCARIRVNGKQRGLGWFTDEVEAARAYDRAALAIGADKQTNAKAGRYREEDD